MLRCRAADWIPWLTLLLALLSPSSVPALMAEHARGCLENKPNLLEPWSARRGLGELQRRGSRGGFVLMVKGLTAPPQPWAKHLQPLHYTVYSSNEGCFQQPDPPWLALV